MGASQPRGSGTSASVAGGRWRLRRHDAPPTPPDSLRDALQRRRAAEVDADRIYDAWLNTCDAVGPQRLDRLRRSLVISCRRAAAGCACRALERGCAEHFRQALTGDFRLGEPRYSAFEAVRALHDWRAAADAARRRLRRWQIDDGRLAEAMLLAPAAHWEAAGSLEAAWAALKPDLHWLRVASQEGRPPQVLSELASAAKAVCWELWGHDSAHHASPRPAP